MKVKFILESRYPQVPDDVEINEFDDDVTEDEIYEVMAEWLMAKAYYEIIEE